MRTRRHTTWWDIANEMDILTCDNGPSGCPAGLSPFIHFKGRVIDETLHWDGFNQRTSERGLRKFMIWVAFAKNPAFRQEPAWLGLYHADRWAFHMEFDVLKMRIPWEYTRTSRNEVKRLARKAGVVLRWEHPYVFWWANWKPERAKMRTPVRGSLNG